MSNYPQGFQDSTIPPQPPKKGSLMWLWILLGVLGGGTVAVCACCGGFGYMGMNAGAQVIAKSLDGNPVMEEHIGPVQSASMNIVKTGTYGQEVGNPGPGKNPIVMDVVGSKGKGTVQGIVSQNRFESGKLILPDGSSHDLFAKEEPAEMPDM